MQKRVIALASAVVLAAGCKDEGPPPPVFDVQAVTALTLPSAPVGSVIATAPTFQALSAEGKAIKGVPVVVEVVSGGGTLAKAPTRTRGGPTPIGNWTLGQLAGPQTVRVKIEPFPAIVFTVNATPGLPTTLQQLRGQNARGPESTPLMPPIEVRVFDQYSNGVPNVTVTWTVTAGGGSLASTTSTSDSLGNARAPQWTLGTAAAGAQRLRAAVGAASTEFTASIQGTAASIQIEQAAPANAPSALPLTTAPTFTVRDASGNILNSVPVTIAITAGGGTLDSIPTVSSYEPTRIGRWRLGNALGAQTVTISAAGIPSALVTTNAVVGPPASITVVEGGGQRAFAGSALTDPLRVLVRDAGEHAVANTTVNWAVAAGGGSVAAATSQTDANGIATMPTWTLGVSGAPQGLRAVAGNASLDIAAAVRTDFNLEVRYLGTPPTGPVADAFTNAVNRIRATIVGAVAPVVLINANINGCVSGLTVTDTIAGLVIFARVEAIDGPGSVLGSAGPCFVRSTDSLTYIGQMRFDSADLDNMVLNGTLEAVILHEMLHVIGVGTLWNLKGVKLGNAPATSPFFTGDSARAACINAHNGASVCGGGVPIEDCVGISGCGGGTINSHWRELVFRTELMTGFVSQTGNPFSKMTIQSLRDMGYVVNLATQDPYTVPPPALMSESHSHGIRMPEPHGPLALTDLQGRMLHRFRDRVPDPQ